MAEFKVGSSAVGGSDTLGSGSPVTSLLASSPETFTGSNGATPNTANTVIALSEGSGGTWTIQSNQGRLRTGTTAFNRTSVRAVVAARTDAEIVFDWTIVEPNTMYPAVFMRHNTTAMDSNTCYGFSLDRDDMTCYRMNGYSGTDIVVKTYSGRSAGQVMRTRIAVFGTSLKARTWLASSQEPTGVWDINVVDTTVAGAGYFGFTNSSGSAGSKDFFVDNFDLLDTETPTQAILNVGGTVTPSGILVKGAVKKFTGSMTTAGALDIRRVVVKVFTASVTAVGTLIRRPVKTFAGGLTPTGAFAKRPAKTFTGAATPTATLKRAQVKTFTGTVTPTGTLNATNVGRTAGWPGIVVVVIRKAGQVRARIRRG